jgi:hypothetical protein
MSMDIRRFSERCRVGEEHPDHVARQIGHPDEVRLAGTTRAARKEVLVKPLSKRSTRKKTFW